MKTILILTFLSLIFVVFFVFKGFWKDIINNFMGLIISIFFVLGVVSGILDYLLII